MPRNDARGTKDSPEEGSVVRSVDAGEELWGEECRQGKPFMGEGFPLPRECVFP